MLKNIDNICLQVNHAPYNDASMLAAMAAV
jgi:hypothetical protein